MTNKIRSKLSSVLKFCIFNILAAMFLPAYAEYYLVYYAPENYNSCENCRSYPSHHHHKASAKKRGHTHHRYHRKIGLFVYYPVQPPCVCCSHPNWVRSQWGDYAVFSTRFSDRTYGITEEEDASYNPDLSTADDGDADLEVN